jgi:outer membrane immunogenic protein
MRGQPMKAIFLSTVAFCLATAAGAANGSAADPATVDWSGVYVGAAAGYAWNHSAYTSTFYDIYEGPAGTIDQDGMFGAVQAGYNFQSGPWVFGPVVDFALADVTGSAVPDPTSQYPSKLTSKMDWFSTIRGRIGYSTGPLLLYGTAGLAIAHASARDTNIGYGFNVGEGSNTFYGWTAGAGAEAALGGGFSVFAQYLYIDLESDGITFSPAPLVGTVDTTINLLEVGLNKRF